MSPSDPYALGVDLGTTHTSAAIYCGGATEAVRLEADSLVSPSVVAPNGDGWLVGSAAIGAATEFRRFKRSLGEVPFFWQGREVQAGELIAVQLNWVIDKVVAERGQPPVATVLTHPAYWNSFRLEEFKKAIGDNRRMGDVAMLDEPVAAATFFGSRRAVATGSTLVVYDLGGGTTDVTVMRKGK